MRKRRYDREKFCILEKNAFILHPLLPDRLMAGQLILVQFVLVRIQLGQREERLLIEEPFFILT